MKKLLKESVLLDVDCLISEVIRHSSVFYSSFFLRHIVPTVYTRAHTPAHLQVCDGSSVERPHAVTYSWPDLWELTARSKR